MSIIETKENETNELLKTHYFKTSYEKMKFSYIEIVKKLNYHVVSIDDDFHEIFIERPHVTISAKIIEINPRETSIDFYINSEYMLFNRKKSLDFIHMVLTELGKSYELKGVALNL